MKPVSAGLAVLMAAALVFLGIASCSKKQKGELVTPKDGSITIDTGGLGRGEVRFFRLPVGGREVVFFAARDRHGEVKTAFDACITCYPHRMGYRQEKDCVVCVYCDTPFHIDELDLGKGNCVPIKIEHRLAGDTITLDQKEVEAGANWF